RSINHGVLTSMDAATVLASKVAKVPTGSGSIPTASPPATEVPTGSDVVPTAGLIFATATVVTLYTRRKGKETMVESETVLSSRGVQVVPTAAVVAPANVSISTGSGVVPTASTTISTATPIFAIATTGTLYTRRKGKEKMVETHTPKKKKRLQEQIDIQFSRELEEELEREAQRMNAQISRDEEIAKIHAEEELQQMIEGLDMSNETIAKHLEEYEQAVAELTIGERIEFISELESAKKQKTPEEVPEEVKSFDEVPKEKIKELIRLVPIKEVYVEALQVKHPIIDWKIDREDLNQLWALIKETLSVRPATNEKEMELWVELKRLYEPDVEDHLWTHTQHIIKALALVMICYKLQVENYSQMATDLVKKIQQRNKMHKAFLLPVTEFPLPEELPTARKDSCHCQKKREATARKIALLSMSRRNCQSKVAVTLS
nr:hypothetical protein [Tanacetum cinerariifolium]